MKGGRGRGRSYVGHGRGGVHACIIYGGIPHVHVARRVRWGEGEDLGKAFDAGAVPVRLE